MKNKTTGVLAGAVALLLAVLFALSVLAGQAGYQNLLLVTPSDFGAQGINPERLEEELSGRFLLTYEIKSPGTAQTAASRHSVTLVGTNQSYAGVTGYQTLDGGFLTKAAIDSKSKYAVLNETAAFSIFGSSKISGNTLKIGGETWTVTGVIQDNDEDNAKFYVPYSVVGGRAESLMVLMDKTVTVAYAKNELKNAGVQDSAYEFINLSKTASSFGERFAVAFYILLCSAILLIILVTGAELRERLRFYRYRMRELYFGELLAVHKTGLLKTMCGLLLLAIGGGAVLLLSLRILGTCLTWQEVTAITGELTAGDFGVKLLWLRNYQIPCDILFWACVCFTIAGFAFILNKMHNREN